MSKKNYNALIVNAVKPVLAKAPRILVFDIETSPHEVASWGLYNQNIGINQIRRPGAILSFAAGWLDVKSRTFSKVEFYSDWEHGHTAMIKRLHELFNEADIIGGHNSNNFDIKHVNREFWLAGLTPPSPYRKIDSLKVARSTFAFASNKLDYLVQQLGIGQKIKHEGMGLWDGVLAGDKKAQATMKKYNIQDTKLTMSLFLLLLPWIKGMPNLNTYTLNENACPACSNETLVANGVHRTNTTISLRYQCESCGAWSRSVNTRTGSSIRPI
jgi:DNA polymerase elongation subunit (family B)